MELLRGLGYEPVARRLGRAFKRIGHFHTALVSRTPGRPPIELHWSLVDRANLYRIPDADVLPRVKVFQAGARSLCALSDEDQFIYLCLHAAKHGVLNGVALECGYDAAWFCARGSGNRLLWFLDIALFLEKFGSQTDWDLVHDRVRRWNVEHEMETCLRLLDLLRPGPSVTSSREALGFAEAPAPGRRGGLGRLLRTPAARRFLVWAMQAWPATCIRPVRLLLAVRLFFPSPADLLRYHGATGPLALLWLYPTHPFHMLSRLLRSFPREYVGHRSTDHAQ